SVRTCSGQESGRSSSDGGGGRSAECSSLRPHGRTHYSGDSPGNDRKKQVRGEKDGRIPSGSAGAAQKVSWCLCSEGCELADSAGRSARSGRRERSRIVYIDEDDYGRIYSR